MHIDIPEDIALRLEKLAKQQNVELDALLRDMLARYEADEKDDDRQWATLADMARNAKELNMSTPEPVDTAARSREILNTEYADYLKSRIGRDYPRR